MGRKKRCPKWEKNSAHAAPASQSSSLATSGYRWMRPTVLPVARESSPHSSAPSVMFDEMDTGSTTETDFEIDLEIEFPTKTDTNRDKEKYRENDCEDDADLQMDLHLHHPRLERPAPQGEYPYALLWETQSLNDIVDEHLSSEGQTEHEERVGLGHTEWIDVHPGHAQHIQSGEGPEPIQATRSKLPDYPPALPLPISLPQSQLHLKSNKRRKTHKKVSPQGERGGSQPLTREQRKERNRRRQEKIQNYLVRKEKVWRAKQRQMKDQKLAKERERKEAPRKRKEQQESKKRQERKERRERNKQME